MVSQQKASKHLTAVSGQSTCHVKSQDCLINDRAKDQEIKQRPRWLIGVLSLVWMLGEALSSDERTEPRVSGWFVRFGGGSCAKSLLHVNVERRASLLVASNPATYLRSNYNVDTL